MNKFAATNTSMQLNTTSIIKKCSLIDPSERILIITKSKNTRVITKNMRHFFSRKAIGSKKIRHNINTR
jgi:hypothetical protein